jgi:predicted NAD/FAD-dependent oxidoreductase
MDDYFDAIVLAIPAPQVPPILGSTAPKLTSLAANVNMLGCWALMCRFAKPLDMLFDGLFVNNGILSWVACDSAKPGRAQYPQQTWVLHASAAWSESHIEDDVDEVAARMIAAFVALGGSVPSAYTEHRWRYAECAQYLDCGYAYDDDAKIGLCGDWLNGGKVQGAWLSGRLLAKQLIAQ